MRHAGTHSTGQSGPRPPAPVSVAQPAVLRKEKASEELSGDCFPRDSVLPHPRPH